MLVLEKQCSKCLQILPSDMFGKNPGHKGGLESRCRKCRSQARKQYASEQNFRRREVAKQKKQEFNQLAKHSIYFFASAFKPEHVKIGYTSNLYKRVQHLLNGTSGDLLLIALLKADDAADELSYHRKFDCLRIDYTEWFMAKSPLIKFISSLDQSLAHQSFDLLPPTQQSRLIIPPVELWIDSLPFLG